MLISLISITYISHLHFFSIIFLASCLNFYAAVTKKVEVKFCWDIVAEIHMHLNAIYNINTFLANGYSTWRFPQIIVGYSSGIQEQENKCE